MTDPSDSAAIPARIGKYRIIASLGQGGMARVFLGLTQGPGGFSKLLVLKEIRAELASDPEFQQMFLTEARIAARLNHGNVVHTYEVGEEGGRCFMAMEYLEGQPLSALIARLRNKSLSTELQLWILTQTLAGLHYAHELVDLDGSRMEVIHRDVSPPNVFVTYEGSVKLLDFGVAKVAGSDHNTRAGTFKGKLAYAAPEQIQGVRIDRRADVFAVGVMLWEVLAKRRLTQGDDDIAVLGSRLSGKHRSLLESAPDTPAELVAICDRAMAHDPNDRYRTAADFQAALEQYLATTAPRSWGKELATTLSSAFAVERAKIRVQVEIQVKAAAESPDSKPLPVVLLAVDPDASAPSGTPSSGHSGTPGAGSRPSMSSAPAMSVTSPTTAGSHVAAAPPTRAATSNKLLASAGLVIAVLVVALGVALRGGQMDKLPVKTSGSGMAAAASSASGSPLPPSPTSAAPAASAPPAAVVSVEPSTVPAVPPAVKLAGTPFVPGPLPKGGKKPGEPGMGTTLPATEGKTPKGARVIDSKDPYAQ